MTNTAQTTNRRVFIIHAAAGASVLAAGNVMAQAALPALSEKDPAAVGLGYAADTTKVDAKKYPQHKADQKCNNCQFWQGAATDAWAGCAMFGRKHIAAAGWCLAWKKLG